MSKLVIDRLGIEIYHSGALLVLRFQRDTATRLPDGTLGKTRPRAFAVTNAAAFGDRWLEPVSFEVAAALAAADARTILDQINATRRLEEGGTVLSSGTSS